jgi:hypothetical protein
MTDLEPGVQLTASTAAAMERLSESSSKPAMTEIEELRARVEALEATQQLPPHQDKLDRLIALDAADDGEPIVLPNSPAGSLVERVQAVCDDKPLGHEARAAILEVAAWLCTQSCLGTAWLLEQEANR